MTEGSFVINSMQAAIASAERVFEIIDEEEDWADDKHPRKLKRPQGEIAFDDVQFGYGKDLLMDGVTFTAKPGQKIAIVGPTGAGKTTLVNLLMRFYEIRGGSIKVDGVDIKHFERHYLRSLFGMVLQDSWIFDGTISENIAYGKVKASSSEIVNAAKMARADYFIRTLPDGYDTLMNDENASLATSFGMRGYTHYVPAETRVAGVYVSVEGRPESIDDFDRDQDTIAETISLHERILDIHYDISRREFRDLCRLGMMRSYRGHSYMI